MAISGVQDAGSWYYIFDDSGKKIATMPKNLTGEVLGFGVDFIVARNGSWYYTYDEKGKKITTMPVSTS